MIFKIRFIIYLTSKNILSNNGGMIMQIIKKLKYSFMGFSIALIVLGACLIIWPKTSALTICYIAGALLFAIGMIKIICYVKRDFFVLPVYHELTYGLLYIIISMLLFFHPDDVMALLPIVIGISIILDCLGKIQTGLELKRFQVRGWFLVFTSSIIGTIFGFLLVLHPFKGVSALMILMGITLVIDGVQNLCFAVSVGKYIQKKSPIDTTGRIID